MNVQKQNTSAGGTQRLAALDWMRGFVMILMAIDHASMVFNGNRFAADSAGMYILGTELQPGPFVAVQRKVDICDTPNDRLNFPLSIK